MRQLIGRDRTDGPPRADGDRVGRRAILTGGALAAGAAGATLLMPSAASATTTPTSLVYAPAPSGGDDTSALKAAMPTRGVMYLQPGTYKLAGMLAVSDGQDMIGAGGGYGNSATILTCTAAGAGVTVSGAGSLTAGFRVDGGSVATAPFTRNGGAGQWVGRTFEDITVLNSAQDGITCLGGQNDAWFQVVSINNSRDTWVLDQGYGGASFSRCEFANGGRYNLRLDCLVTGGSYNVPTDNVFYQCIVEYTSASTVSLVYINGAASIKFDHTSFYASVATSGPLIDVTGSAQNIVLEDSMIQNTPTAIGGNGVWVGSGSQVIFTGSTHFQNLTNPIYLQAGSPAVDVKGLLQFFSCTNHYGGDAGVNPQSYIANNQTEVLLSQRQQPTDYAYVSANTGSGFYTYELADGRKVWGSGSDYTGDVAVSRRMAGVLGVDQNQLFASGYGSTATRPVPSAPMVGSIRFNTDTSRLEVTDGGAWYAGPSQHVLTYFSSTTFVVPANVTQLHCKAIGGGGGGSGAGNMGTLTLASFCYGGAGGGGGMVTDVDLAVTPGDTLTVTVGAGGAGGTGASPANGTTGNNGAAGTAGGTTSIVDGSGHLLVSAPGGGGGAAGQGASLTAAVPPIGAGAYGCNDYNYYVCAPGCGSFGNFNAIPFYGGICGGASGSYSIPSNGGDSGFAPMGVGQRAVTGGYNSPTANGLAGATPQIPGCGGNGGGAGGSGGAGGAGGAGSVGAIEIWWVA
ncbi:MAG TPA: right-handed parallel beta-helix repeat-containing protein [Jatrophihabitantaceae bacterium]|nr:right-handed parallel beta-helix repeat-containing protein [Jatrophihabitantaceae bacterium]